jgi:large subunit ribosomal protein L17
MRHHSGVRKFGRKKNQRNALLKSLALSLVKHGKIKTTAAKAKELRPFIEKLVTKGKSGSLSARRGVTAKLQNRKVESKKLVDEVSKKYQDRKGGYTRIMKLPRRKSDGSAMSIIEFV